MSRELMKRGVVRSFDRARGDQRPCLVRTGFALASSSSTTVADARGVCVMSSATSSARWSTARRAWVAARMREGRRGRRGRRGAAHLDSRLVVAEANAHANPWFASDHRDKRVCQHPLTDW